MARHDSFGRTQRWPWPHRVYAEAWRELQRQGAAGVAFDIRCFELHQENPASDRAFAGQLRTNGNVVLAVVGDATDAGDWHALPPAALFATNAAALGRVWHLALVRGARALELD